MHAVPPTGNPEEEADAFAGEFLAPRALITPDLRRLTFDRLAALNLAWRLSMRALIVRSQRLETINRDQAQRLFKQFSARGYNAAEPYALPEEPPTIVASAVDVHQRQHGYTSEELSEKVAFLFPDEFSQEIAPLHGYTRGGGSVVSLFSGRHRA